MIRLKGIKGFIFSLMLFFPLLGHLYFVLSIPKTISVFYAFVVLLYGFVFIFRYQGQIHLPKFMIPLALYMLYIPIRTHLSELPDRHILTQAYYDTIQISIYFVLLIVYNTSVSNNFINSTIIIFKITIIATVIGSIIQVFDPSFLKYKYLLEEGDIYSLRRVSIYSYERLGLGFSFIPLLSVTIGYALYSTKKTPIFYLIIGGLSPLLSNSRYIIVAYIILTIQLLVVYRKTLSKQIKYLISFSLLAFILFIILSFLGYNFESWFNERLFAEGSIEKTTRYKAISNFSKFFPKYWLFGNGQFNSDEVKRASHAIGSSQIHVGYLAHLVSYGVVGSFFLFSFWFLFAKRLFQTAKLTNYWGSFFAFLTYLWAQATLVHYSIFYYGLIFAFIFDKYLQDQHSNIRNKVNKNI